MPPIVFEDFEEIQSRLTGARRESPGVEDGEVGRSEPLDELRLRATPPGKGEPVEEPGDAPVADGDSDATGLPAEDAGEMRERSIQVAFKGSETHLEVYGILPEPATLSGLEHP